MKNERGGGRGDISKLTPLLGNWALPIDLQSLRSAFQCSPRRKERDIYKVVHQQRPFHLRISLGRGASLRIGKYVGSGRDWFSLSDSTHRTIKFTVHRNTPDDGGINRACCTSCDWNNEALVFSIIDPVPSIQEPGPGSMVSAPPTNRNTRRIDSGKTCSSTRSKRSCHALKRSVPFVASDIEQKRRDARLGVPRDRYHRQLN